MNKNWRGLVKILEIEHLDKFGNLKWRSENINNIFHAEGQLFMLSVCFAGESVPTSGYYLGLDARSDINIEDNLNDTLGDLINEPTTNGYTRQVIENDSFTITSVNSTYRAKTPIVSFQATGGSWGPVKNIFLATSEDDSGYLISSNILNENLTMNDGDIVNLRIGLSLQDYVC
jgi:hypothetical protein